MRVIYIKGHGLSVVRRVVRGGSWNNNPGNLRAANRNNNRVSNRNNNLGLRLVQAAPLPEFPYSGIWEACHGIVITADALLTRRALARHLVKERKAHYHFTVKPNQKILLNDLQDAFRHRGDTPDANETCSGHGRIETRRIRVTTTLNDYPYFPYVAQAFAIGLIKSFSSKGVAETMRDLVMDVRRAFDYLKMTRNSQRRRNLA